MKEASVNSHAVSEGAGGPVASYNNDAKCLFKSPKTHVTMF